MFPLHIERVLDNLLNNASNAIPEEGGSLSIRSYRKRFVGRGRGHEYGGNSERRTETDTSSARAGAGDSISPPDWSNRWKGKMEMESGEGQTTFRVMFPLVK